MKSINGDYRYVIVRSGIGEDSQGRRKIVISPVEGQPFPTSLRVECSQRLIEDYPLGTRFKIKAQLTDMMGTAFLYSYFGWPFEIVV